MAGSLALNVEILGEFKNLTNATRGAEGQLKGLNKTASDISAGIGKAFAAIGIGFSLSVIKQQFEEASKAAIEDQKSMELLAIAMENTGNATRIQVKEAEEAIRVMQIQNAVADDVLRPAYQKLFIATGDVTQSNKLLQVALDASAATGKDLDSVTQAMAKSLAGSDTALVKLIPSLRDAKDPMAELEATFKGAGEAAADTDPYQRMNIVFGEMQEQIGVALLPLLNEFSDWLATPEGQEKLQEIVDGLVAIIEEATKMVEWVIDNKDWLLPMVAAIGGVTTAWNIATGAVNAFKTAAGIATAVGVAGAASVTVLGTAGAGAAAGGYMQGQAVGQTAEILSGGERYQGAGTLFGEAFKPPVTQNVTINVNNGNITAQEIAEKIRKANKITGTDIIR